MSKIEILRKELIDMRPADKVDYLSEYLKNQILFTNKVTFDKVIDSILIIIAELDRSTEKEVCEDLENLGFEIVDKILSIEQIKEKANFYFEEESQEAKDFLENNIDEIAEELVRLKTTHSEFVDLFQNEIEKYEEYLKIE